MSPTSLPAYGHCTPDQVQTKTAVFMGWISQGVLLTNTSLTVKTEQPNSHRELWSGFVEEVLQVLPKRSVSLHLGETASSMGQLPSAHRVEHTHPVIPNTETFLKLDCFGMVNDRLEDIHVTPIQWRCTEFFQ